jgi:3-oxoacyl-[acyl-carrier-protein] synthase II
MPRAPRAVGGYGTVRSAMGRSPSPALAVTGVGVVSGLGVGHAVFEAALAAGASALAPVSAFDTSDCRSHVAARLAEFDPTRFVAAARLRRIDRTGQLAIMSSGLALEDAGLLPAPGVGSDDVGVALGSYTTGLHSLIDYLDKLNALGPIGASALDFSNTVGNAAASLCGLEFGLRGPNVTLSQREASGLGAIAYAATLVRSGQCRAVVTGGVDDFERLFFAVHDRFRVLAHDAGHGEASRPFDINRNGFVLGCGGYLIALEHPDSAATRSAAVHGELLGVGASSSPCRPSDWPVDAEPLARAMRLALDQAALEPQDVAAVFASANSTEALDRLEAEAIASVFGPMSVPVVAVKGALGECGATSAAALVAALAALRSGRLPPTLGLDTRDTACPVDVVASSRPLSPGRRRVALVNAFAAGGTNYSIAVRGPINIQE